MEIYYNSLVESSKIDIIATTHVKQIQIDLFKISKKKYLLIIFYGSIFQSKILAYGLCIYHHKQENKYYMITKKRKILRNTKPSSIKKINFVSYILILF